MWRINRLDLKNDKANFNKTAGYTEQEIGGMDNYIKGGFTDSFRHFYPHARKILLVELPNECQSKECWMAARLFFSK